MLLSANSEPGNDARIGTNYGRDRGRSQATLCSRPEREMTFGAEH
jgi:hypothetical protein